MKKLFKAFLLVAVVACCAVAVAFAGCGDKTTGTTYEGEYHYNSYNNEYGFVVKVTVDGDKITKVENITGDKYVSCSAVNVDYGWTQANVDNWNNNLNALLKAYEGKTVAEIKALEVKCGTGDNVKVPADKEEQTWGDSSLCITDATQGSGRVLLAVQNALSKIA